MSKIGAVAVGFFLHEGLTVEAVQTSVFKTARTTLGRAVKDAKKNFNEVKGKVHDRFAKVPRDVFDDEMGVKLITHYKLFGKNEEKEVDRWQKKWNRVREERENKPNRFKRPGKTTIYHREPGKNPEVMLRSEAEKGFIYLKEKNGYYQVQLMSTYEHVFVKPADVYVNHYDFMSAFESGTRHPASHLSEIQWWRLLKKAIPVAADNVCREHGRGIWYISADDYKQRVLDYLFIKRGANPHDGFQKTYDEMQKESDDPHEHPNKKSSITYGQLDINRMFQECLAQHSHDAADAFFITPNKDGEKKFQASLFLLDLFSENAVDSVIETMRKYGATFRRDLNSCLLSFRRQQPSSTFSLETAQHFEVRKYIDYSISETKAQDLQQAKLTGHIDTDICASDSLFDHLSLPKLRQRYTKTKEFKKLSELSQGCSGYQSQSLIDIIDAKLKVQPFPSFEEVISEDRSKRMAIHMYHLGKNYFSLNQRRFSKVLLGIVKSQHSSTDGNKDVKFVDQVASALSRVGFGVPNPTADKATTDKVKNENGLSIVEKITENMHSLRDLRAFADNIFDISFDRDMLFDGKISFDQDMALNLFSRERQDCFVLTEEGHKRIMEVQDKKAAKKHREKDPAQLASSPNWLVTHAGDDYPLLMARKEDKNFQTSVDSKRIRLSTAYEYFAMREAMRDDKQSPDNSSASNNEKQELRNELIESLTAFFFRERRYQITEDVKAVAKEYFASLHKTEINGAPSDKKTVDQVINDIVQTLEKMNYEHVRGNEPLTRVLTIAFELDQRARDQDDAVDIPDKRWQELVECIVPDYFSRQRISKYSRNSSYDDTGHWQRRPGKLWNRRNRDVVRRPPFVWRPLGFIRHHRNYHPLQGFNKPMHSTVNYDEIVDSYARWTRRNCKSWWWDADYSPPEKPSKKSNGPRAPPPPRPPLSRPYGVPPFHPEFDQLDEYGYPHDPHGPFSRNGFPDRAHDQFTEYDLAAHQRDHVDDDARLSFKHNLDDSNFEASVDDKSHFQPEDELHEQNLEHTTDSASESTPEDVAAEQTVDVTAQESQQSQPVTDEQVAENTTNAAHQSQSEDNLDQNEDPLRN